MKRPLINLPSLGTVHAIGYWVMLSVLMAGGLMLFLHYVLFITFAVPIFGALRRKHNRVWRTSCLASLASAVGFLVFQVANHGTEELIFFTATDSYGFAVPQINAFSLLVVSLILLPLSAGCAIDRIRDRRRLRTQIGVIDNPPTSGS